jgi:hypothetical protein
MFGIDAVVALLGLALPPVVDFVKKKFLKKEQDTPEATISTLATTKPDVLPAFLSAQTAYMEATIKFFNRDVCGIPSTWVINLRAAIRPAGVIIAFIVLVTMAILSITSEHIVDTDGSIDKMLTGIRYSCELIISSWFGDRISLSK